MPLESAELNFVKKNLQKLLHQKMRSGSSEFQWLVCTSFNVNMRESHSLTMHNECKVIRDSIINFISLLGKMCVSMVFTVE